MRQCFDAPPNTPPDALARARWTLHRVDPQTGNDVPVHDTADSVAARVPGTVTGALRDALGAAAVEQLTRADLLESTWELRTRITTPGGAYRVTSRGVATVAQLRIAGQLVATSSSAFSPWEETVRLPAGPCDVALRILPLSTVPVPRKPRARWLSPLVRDRSIRWRRTPLVSHVDWPGARPVLGPWGGLSAVALVEGSGVPVIEPRPRAVRTRLERTESGTVTGVVEAEFRGNPDGDAEQTVSVHCAGAHLTRTVTGQQTRDSGVVRVALTVQNPRLWWPHGAGEAVLHEVRVRVGDAESIHRVGFRTISAEPRADRAGLALRINGRPVFARGAVWAGADPFEVAADPAMTWERLRRLRDAGATMIRVPGTGCYESPDFHRACDELGLMLWQDAALGPLDPPDDPEWRAGLREEVRALSERLSAHPSTVVISAGTEVSQAPVFAGRPAQEWVPEILVEDIPRAIARGRADVVCVPSSPCSDAALDAAARSYRVEAAAWAHGAPVHPEHADGAVGPDPAAPTSAGAPASICAPSPNTGGGPAADPDRAPGLFRSPVDAADGTCHYFGVGAYGKPLTDAITSDVRFAAECLAFAVPPEPASVRERFGTDAPLGDDDDARAETWRAGIARDPGASWTFEDVTVSYVRRLFLDPSSDPEASLARPARAVENAPWSGHAEELEYRRAALAHVFQRAYTQWRRADSSCRGALVLAASSTAPGAGWGLLDDLGRPTAAWYGMKRACTPVTVNFLPREGDGLELHVHNDGPRDLTATVRLTVATVLGGCQQPLEISITVAAGGEWTGRADLADGSFRDLDHAYGFGEREFEAVRAELLASDGQLLARDVHLSGGIRRDSLPAPGLSARWVRAQRAGAEPTEQWAVEVTADGLARFVALDLPGALSADDGYVHLLPGDCVRLPVSACGSILPEGTARVRALGVGPVPISGPIPDFREMPEDSGVRTASEDAQS